MTGWEKNIVLFAETGKAGLCPNCGSEQVSFEEHIHNNRKSITFHCLSCGSSDHFDGALVKDDP